MSASPSIGQARAPHPIPEESKSYLVTLLLSYLLGFFGVDRFYLGRTRSALWKLFTLGGFGYWWLIDIVITICGGQRDAWGYRLHGYDRYKKTVWIVIGAIFGVSLALAVAGATIASTFDSTGRLTPFGWIVIAVLTAGGAAAGAIWFLRRRSRNTPPKPRKGDPVPPRIRALVVKLTELRALYVARAATGDHTAATVIGQLDSLISNVTELFTRLSGKSDKAQKSRAEAEYEDTLGKLAAALDRGYLLDVLAHPRLWENPEQRIQDVQSAITAVDGQIVDNIRQFNARRGMVFQVAIDGLVPRKAMDDWQRDFDKASGSD